MVMVDVFMIGLLYGEEVHLQVDLFIGVLQVYRGDEVLLLEVSLGEVVHGLRVLLLVPLIPDVTHDYQRHAEEHQEPHYAQPQAHRCPVEVSRCPGLPVVVGAGGDIQRHVVGPAPGAAVAGRAQAGGLPGGSTGGTGGGGDAGPAVEAALEGTTVGGFGAVAARVARGAVAVVVVDAVGAGGAVDTGVGRTLVDVGLTALAREAGPAAAHCQVPVQHAVSTIGALQ